MKPAPRHDDDGDLGIQVIAAEFLAHGTIDAAEAGRRLTEIGPAAARVAASASALERILLFTWPGAAVLAGGEGEGLAALRAASPALRHGAVEIAHGEGSLLVYRCEGGGETIDVALNAGEATVAFAMEDESLPEMAPIIAAGDVAVEAPAVALGPRSGVVLRRAPRRPAAAAIRLAIAGNLAARDADLRSGAVNTGTRPTRLDFAVTERCDLRCLHCLADAPERTRSGTACTLSTHLVDRLREDLAFVEHASFAHGGEPLAAPVLFDVLAALREARAGAPAVAHVLTNGMLLDARMVERLAAAGVCSLAVSLDGASAATNDAVRAGGRFAQIVENLRGAARFRRDAGVDLRLGIACVVMAQNAAELPALVDLAAGIGVDWIELTELIPVNAFAERSLVRLDAGPVRDAVTAAVESARACGLVVVDRTDAPVVWRCRLDAEPETARFLHAEEHLRRIDVHPCRATWEHASVSPSGDVHLGDFLGPVIGNLAESRLVEMWNGPAAQAERQRAIRGRLCGAGPVTCLG